MLAALRFNVSLVLLVLVICTRSIHVARQEDRQQNKFLAVLVRTGGPHSEERIQSIRETWAQDLENGALTLFQPVPMCQRLYGDNHWQGLTCLEAKNHLHLMNRTDFDWVLVVDDDVFVFADRLRETLRKMNTSKAEVYGHPYCGDCGHGLKGFCGGGGYAISRQSLLRMASSTAAPISITSGEAFMRHMMSPPNSEWCDVRFACVAQEMGLKAVGVYGLYSNGVRDAANQYDAEEESRVAELYSGEPPLVIHGVRDYTHMQRLYKESLKEKENMKGKETGYNATSWISRRRRIQPYVRDPVV